MTITTEECETPLRLSEHPLQKAGAWALAVMAGRATPQDVNAADLEVLWRRRSFDQRTRQAAALVSWRNHLSPVVREVQPAGDRVWLPGTYRLRVPPASAARRAVVTWW